MYKFSREDLISNSKDVIETSSIGGVVIKGVSFSLFDHREYILLDGNDDLGEPSGKEFVTEVLFEDSTTIGSVIRHKDEVCFVLNFADYKMIGGLFTSGGHAQEESLCHRSNLYLTQLSARDLYEEHSKRGNSKLGLYSDDAVLSKGVSVFKDDNLNLIPPISCDILTIAAPRANSIRRYQPELVPMIYPTLAKRCDRILEIALVNESETLILGAFGCGVFGNKLGELVEIWNTLLTGKYRNKFKTVVFAVPGEETLSKFRGILA